MKAYQPKPCRMCGGDKGDPSDGGNTWHCAPCANKSRLKYYEKNVKFWCGQCDYPWECAACSVIKKQRLAASLANRKARSKSSYFRPVDAERFWQQKAHSLVAQAVKRGFLPNLKVEAVACSDCGCRALEYDHRDYQRPYDIDPVCRSCNKQRGTAVWPTADTFKFRPLIDKDTEAANDA